MNHGSKKQFPDRSLQDSQRHVYPFKRVKYSTGTESEETLTRHAYTYKEHVLGVLVRVRIPDTGRGAEILCYSIKRKSHDG